jgi:hypothetical protein
MKPTEFIAKLVILKKSIYVFSHSLNLSIYLFISIFLKDLAVLLASPTRKNDIVLLDVRDKVQYEICSLPNSVSKLFYMIQ